jgi:AraC-like DNA-binding protein
MTEAASIEITQPASPVEWRSIDPVIGSDQCPLANDPVVRHLGICLHTARARPSEMSPVCADHIASALEAYLKHAHKIGSLPPPAARGGLAPWQLRRAKEMLASRLDEPISLAELARACKLSPGHFARAFRQTTGQPPHRWLIEQRVEKAKQLWSTRRCRWPRSLRIAALPTKPFHSGLRPAGPIEPRPMAPSLAQRPGRGVISAEALSDTAVPCQRLLRRISQEWFVHSRMPAGRAIRLSPATF